MPARNEGVSPGLRYIPERSRRSEIEITGPREKNRFIFLISDIGEFDAIADPAADPASHDARNVPAISSYPPVIFIISFSRRSWTEVLRNPTTKRFGARLPLIPGGEAFKSREPGSFLKRPVK